MPFEIGHQKKGGRKQGIPNKSTKQLRELLTDVLQEEIERIPGILTLLQTPNKD